MSINVVLFQCDPETEPVMTAMEARDEDAARRAWAEVNREHTLAAADVTHVHSEWQFSPADEEFVSATFPNAKATYNFARPEPDGWEEALAAAEATVREFYEKQQLEQATNGLLESAADGVLLPVLRSGNSDDMPHLPSWEVIPGQLYVTLARCAPTPRGTIGMNHVLRNQVEDEEFVELAVEAMGNLRDGLQVNCTNPPGVPGGLVQLDRPGGFVTSMVAEPNFHARMSDIVGAERLLAALPCPDVLYVAGVDSEWADKLREMVTESTHEPYPHAPSLLLIDQSGAQLVVEKTG
ncbi:hypothetical protein SAMN04489726_2206 [Allokutzneria albata]|uniref:Uncharacterized protein n=2 Tax=Allokutzneria albata TaxID=211114 RepID=A0A1G9U6M2_ALLAB|nr:hypothetical protein SAMN04489726_2206 [Allokutzneria albata]